MIVLYQLGIHAEVKELALCAQLISKLTVACRPKFKIQNYRTLRRGENLYDTELGKKSYFCHQEHSIF